VKVAFIGGGSFRTLPIVRGAMARPGLLEGGEVRLLDLDVSRAEAVGRMIARTPEHAGSGCAITWTDDPDRALDGADVVSVSFAVGSTEVCWRSERASVARGFHGSDQLSLSGSFRALTAGPVILDYARRMERLCPDAWLIDYANPVAIYSGLVNNHTRIRALGICGGFVNYRWDLTRLLGRDEYRDDYDVVVAGINHLSFILRGTVGGEDLYEVLGRHLGKGWKPPKIRGPHQWLADHIAFGLRRLVEMYHRFGRIIYSTEGDGMIHLFFDEMFGRQPRNPRYRRPETPAAIRAAARAARRARRQADADFRAHLDRDLDASFWARGAAEDRTFGRNDHDVTVEILHALSGAGRRRIVASRPNHGAVAGFKDRTVLEYSMWLDRDGVRPETDLEVPDCFHGLITSLATHQTLIGDAIAARDPRLLAQALFAYPLYANTRRAKALWRDLLRIHRREIPEVFQKARDYF